MYTIPYSYTDSSGKFERLDYISIGFNNTIEPLRLADNLGEKIRYIRFP